MVAEIESVLGGRARPRWRTSSACPTPCRSSRRRCASTPMALPLYARDVVADDHAGRRAHLPGGSRVPPFPYASHRHPDFWPDPERFDPEPLDAEAGAHHPHAFHPRGRANASCLGNSFSLFETHVIAALLILVTLPPGTPPWPPAAGRHGRHHRQQERYADAD